MPVGPPPAGFPRQGFAAGCRPAADPFPVRIGRRHAVVSRGARLPSRRLAPRTAFPSLFDEVPAYSIERFDSWALTRFADVWTACNDSNVSSSRGSVTGHLSTKVQPLQRMLAVMARPDHTRLRSPIRPHFSPGHMRQREYEPRTFLTGLLDAARDRDEGTIDAVAPPARPSAGRGGLAVRTLPSPLRGLRCTASGTSVGRIGPGRERPTGSRSGRRVAHSEETSKRVARSASLELATLSAASG